MADKVFSTMVEDGSGAHAFQLTVSEAKRTGEIKMPEGDVFKLKDIARNTAEQFVCWMLIGSIPVKLVMGTAPDAGGRILTMVVAGTPRRYRTPDADAFQAFIGGLKVPAGAPLDGEAVRD